MGIAKLLLDAGADVNALGSKFMAGQHQRPLQIMDDSIY